MKSYTITVNGTVYDVTVEEKAAGAVENIVAIDGIAVCVDPANTVKGLSKEQLISIYNGEVTNWKEVGGADAPIVVIGREAGSGTRGAFEELLELVALEISNDEDMEKKLENDKQKLLNELQEMVSKISNIMMINDSFKKYEEAVIRLEELKKLDKEISLKKEITKKNKDIYNIIEPIYKELIKLQDSSKEKNIALNKQREESRRKTELSPRLSHLIFLVS